MHIQVWNDSFFEFPKNFSGTKDGDNPKTRHRVRQGYFYQNCMKDLKAMGKKWVMLTDTDEFARPNHLLLPSTNAKNNWNNATLLSKPGSVIRFLDEQEEQRNTSFPICFHAPRHQFGSKESLDNVTEAGVPTPLSSKGVDGKSMLTTRWQVR
jgi:hypothetical protein